MTGTTHGYTGQRFESESGLYYYKARYYSASIGRFLQPDPILYRSGDLNLYTYVNNDPLNWTDPFGLEPPKKDDTKVIPGKVEENVNPPHTPEDIERMDKSEKDSFGDLRDTSAEPPLVAPQDRFESSTPGKVDGNVIPDPK